MRLDDSQQTLELLPFRSANMSLAAQWYRAWRNLLRVIVTSLDSKKERKEERNAHGTLVINSLQEPSGSTLDSAMALVLLADGVIEESCSPWASPIVLVNRKDTRDGY
ncbi:unnamed protein product [Pleuronectes platessa]|uniref:Reverse transcriptase n=1 Tax=Pleuronectes platessa TaxID=8262 RepID=A0A9N7VM87_PLEPL|nr:unnamed protein product [Pleuronectes platessa]